MPLLCRLRMTLSLADFVIFAKKCEKRTAPRKRQPSNNSVIESYMHAVPEHRTDTFINIFSLILTVVCCVRFPFNKFWLEKYIMNFRFCYENILECFSIAYIVQCCKDDDTMGTQRQCTFDSSHRELLSHSADDVVYSVFNTNCITYHIHHISRNIQQPIFHSIILTLQAQIL